jgi:drug/metabolite transporter (DMT)-like permease
MSGAPDARQPLLVLVLLTLVWGLNWPMMKLGVSGLPSAPASYPPLTFRALSMVIGVPVLAAGLLVLRVPLALPRRDWGTTLRLTASNMIVWHVLIILALPALSSGRAAILGYTMPVFAALWAIVLYGERPGLRQALSVGAATIGVALLLTHEFSRLAGSPAAVAMALAAAAVWALGTHELRRATLSVPLLTVVFWMTALTAWVLATAAWIFERTSWQFPASHVQVSILYNAVGVFGFAHAAWFYLARTMPPLASSVSVMMIPVLGTFSGAWWLGEALHWQDFAAVVLMVLAIGLALLRRPAAPPPAQRA